MTTRAQRVRSGIFVAIGAALLLIVVVIFGAVRLVRGSDRYVIYFDDTVYGLENGGAVYFEGVRVGSVDELAIAQPGEPGRVRAEIEIDRGTPIHTDTRAFLLYAGITGVKEIDLRGGSPAEPVLARGGTIPVGKTELDKLTDRLAGMTDQASELLASASRIAANLAKITEPEATQEVMTNTRRAAANLAAASDSLNAMVRENRAALHDTLTSLDHAAKNASDLLGGKLTSFATRADDLAQHLDQLVRGSSGQLRSTISDLAQASRSFKDLVRDLRQSPSRLLFSRPPPERKLP
jgi:phospholipid/cholesterol/gamma-HCH transport system substrate-binding protein